MQSPSLPVTVVIMARGEEEVFLSDVRVDRFLRVFRVLEDDGDDAQLQWVRSQLELAGWETCLRSDTHAPDGTPFLTYRDAARHLEDARREVKRARWRRSHVPGPIRRLAKVRPDP